MLSSLARFDLAKDVKLEKVRQHTLTEIELLIMSTYQKFANYVAVMNSRRTKIVTHLILVHLYLFDNVAVRVMKVVTTLHTIVIVGNIHAKQHPAW